RVEIDEAQLPIRWTARPAKVGQQHAEQVAAAADQRGRLYRPVAAHRRDAAAGCVAGIALDVFDHYPCLGPYRHARCRVVFQGDDAKTVDKTLVEAALRDNFQTIQSRVINT